MFVCYYVMPSSFSTTGRRDLKDIRKPGKVIEAMAAGMYDRASTKDPVRKRFV